MECSQIKALLRPYAKGRLNDERVHIVESHLKNCPECKKVVKKERSRRVTLMVSFIIAVLCLTSFGFYSSGIISKSFFQKGKKIVISNIIIEIYSKDQSGDLTIVKKISRNFNGEVISENPLSIRLVKPKVNSFIGSLNRILVFPDGTPRKVKEFIKPLSKTDSVVVKIKFIDEKKDTELLKKG